MCSGLLPETGWDIQEPDFSLLTEWKFLSPEGTACRPAGRMAPHLTCVGRWQQITCLWEPPGRKKQLCSINQNVVIEQSDPRKLGQVEVNTAGAERSSPCLVFVWLCKDMLGGVIFLFIDGQELYWRNKYGCVCLTGGISSLSTGRRNHFPFSPTSCLDPGVFWRGPAKRNTSACYLGSSLFQSLLTPWVMNPDSSVPPFS